MKYDKEHKTSHGIIVSSNTSEASGTHNYDWEVHLDAPSPGQLDRIERVEYVLHPTFPDPVRISTDRSSSFSVSSRGWGEFDIGIKIHFKDGTVEKLKHPLKLFPSSESR